MSIATTPRRMSKSLWSYNPIPTGCVLYLPLWHPDLSGSEFKSIDLYGHTCTVTGATKVADGRSFNGSSDKIVIPANPILNGLSSPLTIVGRMNASTWSNDKAVVSQRDGGAVQDNFQLVQRTDHGDDLRLTIWVGGVGSSTFSTATYPTGIEFHYAVTYDGSFVRFYKDGAQHGDAVAESGTIDTDTTPTNIGWDSFSGYFDGSQKTLSIYNVLLTEGEIAYHDRMTRGR